MEENQDFKRMLVRVIKGIDIRENTEWEKKTKEVSENIRDALVKQMQTLRTECDKKFLDYCNTIKSLLAVYNFGNMKDKKQDTDLIVEGVSTILDHVTNYGYDITPYLDAEESRNIFSLEEGKKPEITLSVTTVFTTLVYFRRAFKRQKLALDEKACKSIFEKVTQTVSEILLLFVRYIEANKYTGWGFTFDSRNSRSVRLSDTYAVVDAISRFQDAFTKEDEQKGDPEFINAITEYADEVLNEKAVVERCLNSMYKAAFNVYDAAKSVYGRSVFYVSAERGKDDTVNYVYSKTDYEQISNSSRSSALFNPLYVAMITMYGYNDKEIVIRRFMDDYDLTKKYYTKFETNLKDNPQSDKKTISHYSTILGGLDPVDQPDELDEKDKNDEKKVKEYEKQLKEYKKYKARYKAAIQKFHDDLEAVKMLEVRDKKWSDDYSDSKLWRERYDVARIFQKYLETQEPDELMKIPEYRDYFNATKDAIDQVQIMYRNFDNNQRLSVVDTDYVMFNALDIKTTHSEYISKLNKANISVNNLRPMMLSSKIMIVNALTKYPQADLEELYNAIIDSQYQRTVEGKRNKAWLWNADGIDMNSTARHCEAIAYDYFDYYERYELGLRAITKLKSNIGDAVSKGFDNETGEFSVKKAMGSEDMISFKHIVLDITRQKVEIINNQYQIKLREKEQRIRELEDEKAKLEEKHTENLEKEKQKYQEQLEALSESRRIGDTMRKWIREEMVRYMSDFLSQIILNKINGTPIQNEEKRGDQKEIRKLLNKSKLADANILPVREYIGKMREEINERPDLISEYAESFYDIIELQQLFEAAFNGIFDIKALTNVSGFEPTDTLEDWNNKFAKRYKERLDARRLDKEYVPYDSAKKNDTNQ